MESYEEFCWVQLAQRKASWMENTDDIPLGKQRGGRTQIRFHGVAILEPLLTQDQRREMQEYQQCACNLMKEGSDPRGGGLLVCVQSLLNSVQGISFVKQSNHEDNVNTLNQNMADVFETHPVCENTAASERKSKPCTEMEHSLLQHFGLSPKSETFNMLLKNGTSRNQNIQKLLIFGSGSNLREPLNLQEPHSGSAPGPIPVDRALQNFQGNLGTIPEPKAKSQNCGVKIVNRETQNDSRSFQRFPNPVLSKSPVLSKKVSRLCQKLGHGMAVEVARTLVEQLDSSTKSNGEGNLEDGTINIFSQFNQITQLEENLSSLKALISGLEETVSEIGGRDVCEENSSGCRTIELDVGQDPIPFTCSQDPIAFALEKDLPNVTSEAHLPLKLYRNSIFPRGKPVMPCEPVGIEKNCSISQEHCRLKGIRPKVTQEDPSDSISQKGLSQLRPINQSYDVKMPSSLWFSKVQSEGPCSLRGSKTPENGFAGVESKAKRRLLMNRKQNMKMAAGKSESNVDCGKSGLSRTQAETNPSQGKMEDEATLEERWLQLQRLHTQQFLNLVTQQKRQKEQLLQVGTLRGLQPLPSVYRFPNGTSLIKTKRGQEHMNIGNAGRKKTKGPSSSSSTTWRVQTQSCRFIPLCSPRI
nr:PREDICTED: uncharacterized protein LOC102358644 isoform X2 [Latimeria chalumnae]|eukprot:XP_014340018.1 PREDICTED: uncharacterized protein LOC102358644 isoform X2 [Latimeria chalumnae]